MSCKSKENTLKFLRKKGIIGNLNRINDLTKFEQLNNQYTEYAKTEYGIDNGQKLFNTKEIKSKALRGHSYHRDNIVTYFRAIPNNEMFDSIDKVIEKRNNANEDLYEPDYFDDYLYETSEETIKPGYEKYIIYKKNLLKRLENRIAKIEAEKKKFSSDTEALKELSKLENEIKNRIEGSQELGLEGLKGEIALLENNPPIEKFNFYAEKDFDRLEKLSQSENPEDLQEARSIINFYEALGTFDVKKTHPIFKIDDIFDDKGNLSLSDDVANNFVDLREKAKSYENIIQQKEKKSIIDNVNNNSKIKNVFKEKEFTYDELFFKNKGLKDTPWIDMFLMDITNGIFSQNGIIPQVMMNNIQNAYESNLVYAKSVENRVSDIQSEVEKELSNLGYSINVPGIKGVSYDLFRAVDENGQYRDNIIQRYTSNFSDNKRKMQLEFDEKLNKARSIEDPVKKQNAYKEAYIHRNNWYKKNTVVIDVRKVPEIINDSSLASFQEHFNANEAESYSQELKQLLGEQGYKEEVDKQIKLLRNYQTMLDVFTDNIITETQAEDYKSLSEEAKSKIEMWIKRNNPFIMTDSYYSGKPITKGKLKLDSNMTYNYAVPRKNKISIEHSENGPVFKDTEKATGYYDKRFETIESNDTLKEFHKLLIEVQQKMYDTMPVEVREKFSAYSLPALEKNLIEILFDKNTPLIQRLSKAAKEIYDRIRALFGINPQDNLSYANVDPISGQPEYRVNSGFLKSNSQEINTRYTIELQRLKKALGLSATQKISRFDTYNIENSSDAIAILAENLGVEPSLSAIKTRLKNENLKSAEIGKILKNAITHQVVSEKSFDLPKILKLYSYMTMEYAARQEVLPLLEMMKRHYEQIKKPAITNTGDTITNVNTGETRLDGERSSAITQMNSWFERVVLGNYGSKNELGDTRIKRIAKLGLTGNEKIDALTSKIQTTVDGRIYNTDEKIMKGKIPEILKELEDEMKIATENKNSEAMSAIGKMIKRVENIETKLGKHFSATAAFDAMFNFIRFKGLGWNLSSYITNFAEGQIANMTIAATGDYFTPENIYRANDIVKGSFAKNLSFGKYATEGARKTRALMDRYAILQDASNELQKASAKSAFSSFKNLSPYEGTRRTEYLNQAPLMIATLLDQQITGKDGEVSNLWDAMDADGSLKENFKTQENIVNWEEANGQQYNDFKSHIRKMIVNGHGDYDELRGMMASEYVSGKALLMFKRWMSRQFYQRFAMIPQTDIEVGMKNYKGRYLSHTQASGFMHGAIVGFGGLGLLGAGPLGLLIGGAAGATLGKFYGANTGLNFLQEMAFVGKELFLNMARIPVNNLVGKDVIKHDDYKKLAEAGVSDRDMKNMRANLIDMSITLAWVGMLLFTKAALWDDEDEKDAPRRKAHNLLANRFMQLSSQSSMYLNPVETWDNTVGGLPILRFFTDVGKVATEASEFLEGKDTIPTGPNAGESALYNQLERTLFPGIIKSGAGFGIHTTKQFQKSPFDSWFENDETTAKKRLKAVKAKTKKQYLLDDMNPEDTKKVKKQIDKFYKKGKDEKYTDVLERIELNEFQIK